jgi:hypothetical protein
LRIASSRASQPSGRASHVDLGRDPQAELVVLVDDPPRDVERGHRQLGESQEAAQGRRRRLHRVGRLARARDLHRGFEHRAQHRGRQGGRERAAHAATSVTM